MTSSALDQVQLEALGQILAAGGHHDVAELLGASLSRLVAFWPAQAGALLYISPQDEPVSLEHGPLNTEARTLIEQARTTFARRDDSGEPSIGYYALEGGYNLIELPLQSSDQGVVGLLHLVVADTSDKGSTTVKPDEDLLLLLVSSIGGEADKLALLQRAERDLRELRFLTEVGQSLAINLDLSSLLRDITLRAPRVVGAERCSIFILDEANQELVLEIPGHEREYRMPADRGIAGWVITHGIPQIVNDVEQDARWYDVIAREADFPNRSLACVPIRVKERIIGAMQLLNKRDSETFTDKDVQLLTALATQAGIAIANARIYRNLQAERDQLLSREIEDKTRIARMLEEGPTQRLTATTLNIAFVKKLLRAMPERVAGELDTLSELVQRTIDDLHSFLFEMYPMGLETQGLLAIMQHYVANWHDPTGNETRLRLQAPANVPRLPTSIEAAIFVILQEAIKNACEHARAAEVVVYLYVEEVHLVTSVRDRGRGFHMNLLDARYEEYEGQGIDRMRERANQIDADLRIRSEPGNGTIVELRVPLT